MTHYPYFKSVEYLEGLVNIQRGIIQKGLDPSIHLDRTNALITELGLSDFSPKYIHIAGTSGKGSVSNLIYQSLLKQKVRVGLFTSPFVTSTIEKISSDGLYISPNIFTELTDIVKPALDRVYEKYPYGCPSYFECIFAIALLYFKKQKCEYLILETGLGGRYDSTNIIKNPVVTVITNVDLDHTEILGDTVEKIAYDKAGIIKTGSIFFTTEPRPKLLKIFKEICKEKDVECVIINTKDMNIPQKNIALASEIIKHLGFSSKGLLDKNMILLPARFETISTKPLVVIDGAHNPAKMLCTAQNLKQLKYKKCILVIGIAGNKNIDETMKIIAPLVDEVYITRSLSPFRKVAEPKDICTSVKKYARGGVKIKITLDPINAFETALNQVGKDDIVLVTGSFFLAGDIRATYYPESFILKKRKSK